ncbi:MAG: hypothetical protein A2096_07805 [Spirochaetes bacterium GWF1_41_5]|nr:MAG: hypothetical protein A2096_07805 [Spirochaetes bacterium GWF1_41_5]HBE01678.1 hypothetical protein [Spirochaetia bacterium]
MPYTSFFNSTAKKNNTIYFTGKLPPPLKAISLIEYPAEYKGNIHSHESFQIIMIISGMFLIENKSENIKLQPNETALIPPGRIHQCRCTENRPVRIIQILHEPLPFQQYEDLFCLFGKINLNFQKAALDKKLLNNLENIISAECHNNQPGGSIIIFGQVMMIFGLLFRQIMKNQNAHIFSRADIIINKTMAYMEDHYQEKINLKTLAANVGLKECRFSEIFKQYTGYAPMHYVINYKLNKAKLLLLYSKMSITAVSEYLGFDTLHYFSRIFKKQQGISPAQFAKKNQIIK